MSNPHRLESVEIRGFRAFDELSIPNLADVNLIVGKNNIGKTSVLEALELYFSRGSRFKILEFLNSRQEYSFRKRRGYVKDGPLALEALFYGRPDLITRTPYFTIGPINDHDSELAIDFVWLQELIEQPDTPIRYRALRGNDFESAPDVVAGFRIRFGSFELLLPLERFERSSSLAAARSAERTREVPVVYLASTGMSSEEIGRIWDTIALTEDEEEVLSALRTLFPDIEKLVLVQGPSSRGERILMAKLAYFSDPVPFKSLGEGVNHLLSVFLALIRTRGGVLLIDEVENGIHYSVQAELWHLIFRQAAQWDTQVFATTHSWDCVEGFQVAALEAQQGQGRLFRLEGARDMVRVVSFEPHEIEIAKRENIEVR
ncbi:ATP/GTP-binding protein [Bosea eneae]|uniref:ATP/GTP-binding protein n=1 Tax=Bosea eneae TaxID=151454 RepID=A0ABW0INL4_9HYPH